MSREKFIPNFDDLIQRYEAGESLKSVAEDSGVSRQALGPRFERAGVKLRTQGEAETAKWLRMAPEARIEQVRKAHDAVRGMKRSHEELVKRATRRVRLIGKGEADLIKLLSDAGIDSEAQLPVDKYNIDVAVRPVAMEVHRQTYNPLRDTRLQQRVKDLGSKGWLSLYIWTNPQRSESTIGMRCLDQILPLLELACQNPAAFGEYRVIGANGEPIPTPQKYLDQFALVEVSEATLNS